MKYLVRLPLMALLLLAGSCAIATAAEKIVFPGGHEMLVREVNVLPGDQLELTLLEGGTIVLPQSAIQDRQRLTKEEAMEAWKDSQNDSSVPSRSGSLKDLDWQKRMKALASGPAPVDNGHSPEAAMLYSKRGYTPPQPSSTLGFAPYGVTAPPEGASSMYNARRTNLRQFPLQEAVINRGSSQAQPGSRDARMGQFMRSWKKNGYEPPPAGQLPGREELRGK